MKNGLIVVLVILAVLAINPVLFATSPEGVVQESNGTLVLVGGGLEADNRDILEAVKTSVEGLCRRLGRTKPRIGVMPSSKQTLAEARDLFENDDRQEPRKYPGYRKWLTRAGFEPVLVPVTLETVFRQRNAAEDPRNVRLVQSCQIIFLLGGDQGRHAISLLRRDGSDSAVLKAIRGRLADGGAVMGTSAGTHALANPMFGWGQSGPILARARLERVRLQDVAPGRDVDPTDEGNGVILPGLGLLPDGFLTDTHFDARGRLGRLIVGVRDLGARWGIGVDENTALLFRNGRGTVRGERGVFLIDTASATFSPAGEAFCARDLRVTLLTSGDTWNAVDGSVESTKPLARPAFAAAIPSADIFAAVEDPDGNRLHPYEVTHVMRELINSRQETVEAWAARSDFPIRLRFRKTGQTRGNWASKAAFTIASLGLEIDGGPSAKAPPEGKTLAAPQRAREIRFRPAPRRPRPATDDRE